jgi:hypothetical protein
MGERFQGEGRRINTALDGWSVSWKRGSNENASTTQLG